MIEGLIIQLCLRKRLKQQCSAVHGHAWLYMTMFTSTTCKRVSPASSEAQHGCPAIYVSLEWCTSGDESRIVLTRLLAEWGCSVLPVWLHMHLLPTIPAFILNLEHLHLSVQGAIVTSVAAPPAGTLKWVSNVGVIECTTLTMNMWKNHLVDIPLCKLVLCLDIASVVDQVWLQYNVIWIDETLSLENEAWKSPTSKGIQSFWQCPERLGNFSARWVMSRQ